MQAFHQRQQKIVKNWETTCNERTDCLYAEIADDMVCMDNCRHIETSGQCSLYRINEKAPCEWINDNCREVCDLFTKSSDCTQLTHCEWRTILETSKEGCVEIDST